MKALLGKRRFPRRRTWACLATLAGCLLTGTSQERVSLLAQGQQECVPTIRRVVPDGPQQWGVDIPVSVLVTWSCPDGSVPPAYLTMHESWPAPLRPSSGLGNPFTAFAAVDPDAGGNSGYEAKWILPNDPSASPSARVGYVLQSGPIDADDPPAGALQEPSGAWRVSWPTILRWESPTGERSTVPADVASLRIAADAPVPGCEITRRRRIEPAVIRVGEPMTVALGVTIGRCDPFAERMAALLVLDPPTNAGHVPAARAAVSALVAAADERRAIVALALPGSGPNRMIGPSSDMARIDAAVRDALGEAGGAPALLGPELLQQLPSWPGHHRQILWLTHAGAPARKAGTIAALRRAADSAGVGVEIVCVGGGCSDAPGADAPRDWASLARDAGSTWDAQSGRRLVPETLSIHDSVGGFFDVEAGSARPAGGAAGEEVVRWDALATGEGRTITATYRARPALDGVLPLGGGGAVVLHHAGGGSSHAPLPLGTIEVRPRLSPRPNCVPRAAKRVAPGEIELGATADIHIAMGLDCPDDHAAPMDIVLALDASESMAGERWEAERAAVEAVLDMLAPALAGGDLRIGLVIFHHAVRTRIAPTTQRATLRAALAAIEPEGGTNLAGALEDVVRMLDTTPADRAGSALLLSDGRDSAGTAALLAVAEQMRVAGTPLWTLCYARSCDPALAAAATRPRHHLRAPTPESLSDRLAGWAAALRAGRPESLVLTDHVPSDVRLDVGSIDPVPTSVVTTTLGVTISWGALPTGGGGWTYRVEPLRAGDVALGTAHASWTGLDGSRGETVVPAPFVRVLPPAASGPCIVEATSSAVPDRVEQGAAVTATWSVAIDCTSGDRLPRLDVVLALDRSASMGALGRIAAARSAALAFVDALDARGESVDARVGLVAFADRPSPVLGLTVERDELRRVARALRAEGVTDLPAALEAARIVLDERRPSVPTAVILISDGDVSHATAAASMAAARRLHATGVALATICTAPCDPTFAAMASRPELAFDTATPSEWPDVVRALAETFAPSAAEAVNLRIAPPSAGTLSIEAVASGARGDAAAWSWFAERLEVGDRLQTWLRGRPETAGSVPMAWSANVRYRYGARWGNAPLPIPSVEVEGDPTDPKPVQPEAHRLFLPYLQAETLP